MAGKQNSFLWIKILGSGIRAAIILTISGINESSRALPGRILLHHRDLANGVAILLLAFSPKQKFTATTMTRE